MRTRPIRTRAAAATAVGLAALALGAAPASAGVSDTGENVMLRFYDNGRYVLFTGPPLAGGCTGEGIILFPEHVVAAPSGVENHRVQGTNDADLYDLEALGLTSGWDLFLAACVNGTIPDPTPVASGTVEEWVHTWLDASGRVMEKDEANGTLLTADGSSVAVQGTSLARADATGEVTAVQVRLGVRAVP